MDTMNTMGAIEAAGKNTESAAGRDGKRVMRYPPPSASKGLQVNEPSGVYAVGAPGLIDEVKAGFSFRLVEALARELGLSANQLAGKFLQLSRATLSRRRQSGRLTPDESDKVARYSRLAAAATRLMQNDSAAARRWLSAPLPLLGGETPLEYARTEVGAREVEQLINRLEYGVYS